MIFLTSKAGTWLVYERARFIVWKKATSATLAEGAPFVRAAYSVAIASPSAASVVAPATTS